MKYFVTTCVAVLALLFSNAAFAQWDDLYFDPSTDQSIDNLAYRSNDRSEASDRRYVDDSDYAYYEDEYDYYNDYDFYYTSRIRRFHRPLFGFGFFDPVYIDAAYYDPFMSPSLSVLIYDDLAFRNFTRLRSWGDPFWGMGFNRWNRRGFGAGAGFGWGFNSGFNLGFNSGFGFSPFNNPFLRSTAYFCPPSWGGSNSYTTITSTLNDAGRNTVYNPRRSGTRIDSRYTSPNRTRSSKRRGTVGRVNGLERQSPLNSRGSKVDPQQQRRRTRTRATNRPSQVNSRSTSPTKINRSSTTRGNNSPSFSRGRSNTSRSTINRNSSSRPRMSPTRSSGSSSSRSSGSRPTTRRKNND